MTVVRAISGLKTWLILALLALPASTWAQGHTPTKGVGITEHLGDPIPGDLQFKDATGKTVRLEDYLDGERPVILTLVYYNCPMLCNMILNGLIEGMMDLPWTTAEDFQILSVSIDSREGPELAAQKKKSYLEQYSKPKAGQGWHFLTGDRESIQKLADSVGFGFKYDPNTMEYAHGAAIFFISPKGKQVRALYGVKFSAKQLKLALTEAGGGKLGTLSERLELVYTRFDPETRQYEPHLTALIGGAIGLAMLIVALLALRRRRLA